METWWWVVIVAVLIVGAIVVLLRSRQSQASRAQDHRITAQQEDRAQSATDEIGRREDRRLADMSDDDREWETASLERNRVRDARTRQSQDPE